MLLTKPEPVETDPVIHRRCRRRLLCKTIAGNRCELLTITSAYDSDCLAGGEAEVRSLFTCFTGTKALALLALLVQTLLTVTSAYESDCIAGGEASDEASQVYADVC